MPKKCKTFIISTKLNKNKMIFPKLNKNLWQLLGPSVVFVALSLNGGEMLLWPDLVNKYGLFILWMVPVILLLQFCVNLEIERYTVATGENTVSALIGFNKFFKVLFPLSVLISLMWPGWISNSGNLLAFIIGFPQHGAIISVFLLLLILLIWFSKKSYNLMENMAKFGLFGVLLIGIFILVASFQKGIPEIKVNFFPQTKDKILYVSALAFGGVAGVLNLVQSHWVMAKGYGASTFGKKTEFDWENQESVKNWNDWWKILIKEHTVLFYFGNLFGIFLIAAVAFLTLTGAKVSGFGLITYQVNLLNNLYGIGWLWGIGIILLFFMAQMTILDASGRLLHHSFPSIPSSKLSQYFGLIGVLILAGIVFFPNFNQPSLLLQFSAFSSSFIMALYPPFLLAMNLKLPKPVRPKLLNIIGIIACSLFYLISTIWGVFGGIIF